MKWFKHYTTDHTTLTSKLLRSHFGASGYGVYMTLLELVAENVDGDVRTWGMVDSRHTIETLADECGVTPEYLKEFLAYCDEKKIFEKKANCLYWPDIKSRLDNWTYDKAKKDFQVTSKSLPSHFGKKENKKEKEKEKGFKFNPQKTAELKAKAYALVGKDK
jgi:hypothetical protein